MCRSAEQIREQLSQAKAQIEISAVAVKRLQEELEKATKHESELTSDAVNLLTKCRDGQYHRWQVCEYVSTHDVQPVHLPGMWRTLAFVHDGGDTKATMRCTDCNTRVTVEAKR